MKHYESGIQYLAETLAGLVHDHPEWAITWKADDLAQLDFIRVGYVKSEPSLAVVCDKGKVFEMPENDWEKARFAHNGRDAHGNRVGRATHR